MAFMIPAYTNDPFVSMHNADTGEDCSVPADVENILTGDGWETFERITGKWWCRLSAPGYMDCTDWSGPYETVEEARAAIVEMFEVDPDSGDEIEQE